MIKGITFEALNTEQLKEATYKYNPNILSTTSITHCYDNAMLPYDCYPSVNINGSMFKDNLCNLYEKLHTLDDKSEISGKIYEELICRWSNGKNGRLRQDICGKRCNFTARSVLTPNPHLELTQVGLPLIWKSVLTLVDDWKEDMEVVAVFDDKDRKYDPRYRKPGPNSKVLRKLKNGELVIVNRQPTLRESNMVAMEVIWINTKTVQMHPGLFSMFDADCDGDEVNIHLPQIPQKHLNCVHIKKAIWYFGESSLGPSIVQDATVGLCLDNSFKNKRFIHKSIVNDHLVKTDPSFILRNIRNAYKHGTQKAFDYGFSVGFDFHEVDFMVEVGAKGKGIHKEKIRSMLSGIYDNQIHFKDCQDARLALMSTSLKTAETGYISRRMAYHFDDIKQDEYGLCTDYDKMIIQYPPQTPEKYRHMKNIGLQLMMLLMPPLTQKMLDSFHSASIGESIENKTDYFVSLVNCTNQTLHEIYKTQGILSSKKWLYNELKAFFNDAFDDFWIDFLVDILCITGKPIGIGMTSLFKRFESYIQYDKNLNIPIIKMCKFGSPIKFLKKMTAVVGGSYDDLKSNHSRELFFS